MSIGAGLYGYRSNFNGKQGNKIPKKKKYTVKLIDLMRKGYRTVSKYDDDLFIGICQWLIRKGYPCGLRVSDNTSNIDEFFMDALFSICPFHFESLIINNKGFNLFEWQEQFDLFNETEITGLNFYRNRASMPIKDFHSTQDIYRRIYTKYGEYNEINEKLKGQFNRSWKNAVWILGKDCYIRKDYFIYQISYGCKDDFKAHKEGKSCSHWEISIESEKNENYIDFCLRVYENYEKIISGDKSVLISEYKGKDFYRGGHFKLKQ